MITLRPLRCHCQELLAAALVLLLRGSYYSCNSTLNRCNLSMATERTKVEQKDCHSYADNESLSMTRGESTLDPRIVRIEEGWAYFGTHYWKMVECKDLDCAAKVKEGKSHYHRVHDPSVPRAKLSWCFVSGCAPEWTAQTDARSQKRCTTTKD